MIHKNARAITNLLHSVPDRSKFCRVPNCVTHAFNISLPPSTRVGERICSCRLLTRTNWKHHDITRIKDEHDGWNWPSGPDFSEKIWTLLPRLLCPPGAGCPRFLCVPPSPRGTTPCAPWLPGPRRPGLARISTWICLLHLPPTPSARCHRLPVFEAVNRNDIVTSG